LRFEIRIKPMILNSFSYLINKVPNVINAKAKAVSYLTSNISNPKNTAYLEKSGI